MSSPTLAFHCPNCATKLTAATAAAGHRVTCPKCQSPVKIPQAAPPQPSSGKVTPGTSSLRAECPQCGEVAYVDRDKLGADVICSECLEKFKVERPPDAPAPSSPQQSTPNVSHGSDDLGLAPLATPTDPASSPIPPVTPNTPASSSKAASSESPSTPPEAGAPGEDDFKLADPVQRPVGDIENWVPKAPVQATRPPQAITDSEHSSGPPIAHAPVPSEPATIPVSCPVCGTRVHADAKLEGKTTPCPDCFSVIPVVVRGVAKPEVHAQAPIGAPIRVSGESPSLQPATGRTAVTGDDILKGVAEGVLEHAEAEQVRREERDRQAQQSREQFGGISFLFSFLQHPGALLWLTSLSMGMVAFAGCFRLAVDYGSDGLAAIGGVALSMSGCVILLFWLLGAGGVWLAILQETAAGKRLIDEWRFSLFGDSLVEAWLLVFSSVVAMIPGAIVVLLNVTSPLGWGAAIAAFSFFFPLVLLSLLDNESLLLVFSDTIFKSLISKAGYWFLLWIGSLCLLGLTFLCAKGMASGGFAKFCLSALGTNALVLIYFRTLGLFTWRIVGRQDA